MAPAPRPAEFKGRVLVDRSFLFDLDGTLVDSTALHALAFRRVLERLRPSLAPEFTYDPIRGMQTADAFRQLGVASAEVERFTHAKREAYLELVEAGQLAIIEGSREVLALLASRGRPCYVVTSASRRSAIAALRACALLDCFQGVVSADDVSAHKPDPQPFLHCVRTYGLEKFECVVVEDAPSGVAAARAAGIEVIGVNNDAIAGEVDAFYPSMQSFYEALARA